MVISAVLHNGWMILDPLGDLDSFLVSSSRMNPKGLREGITIQGPSILNWLASFTGWGDGLFSNVLVTHIHTEARHL